LTSVSSIEARASTDKPPSSALLCPPGSSGAAPPPGILPVTSPPPSTAIPSEVCANRGRELLRDADAAVRGVRRREVAPPPRRADPRVCAVTPVLPRSSEMASFERAMMLAPRPPNAPPRVAPGRARCKALGKASTPAYAAVGRSGRRRGGPGRVKTQGGFLQKEGG